MRTHVNILQRFHSEGVSGESEGEAGRGVDGQGLLPNQDLRLQSQAACRPLRQFLGHL